MEPKREPTEEEIAEMELGPTMSMEELAVAAIEDMIRKRKQETAASSPSNAPPKWFQDAYENL